jgi:L-Ala-D/L-Glu epimerase
VKIVEAEAIPIRIPLRHPFTIAVGTLTHTNHVLVRLRDDEGRVGWGETTTFHAVYGYDQKSLYHVLTDHLLPAIQGFDPRDMCALHRRLDQAIPQNLMAKTGVDLAAYDLAAQAAGVPIFGLIGGRRVARVPVVGIADIVAPEAAAAAAVEQVAQGFDTIKIKIGKDPVADIRRVEAVRQAV